MEAILIDAFEFCRLRQAREGEFAVADLPRLVQEAASNDGTIRWSLQGGANQLGHPLLSLSVAGSVRLMCQRCLAPFEFAIDSHSEMVLAKDDATADHIESTLDDDEIEVIVASHQFNVTDLIEDEVLLALPVSPKHETCPGLAMANEQAGTEKAPSPFEALKNWKQ